MATIKTSAVLLQACIEGMAMHQASMYNHIKLSIMEHFPPKHECLLLPDLFS